MLEPTAARCAASPLLPMPPPLADWRLAIIGQAADRVGDLGLDFH
jgi:hypothetical protein